MEIPHRILRAHALDLDPTLRDLTTRELERQERILKIAQSLFVRYGRHTITFRGLATAMKMATATLRKHYTCLDALLAALLHRHLQQITKAMGEVPQEAPNRAQAPRRRRRLFRGARPLRLPARHPAGGPARNHR
jgi:AcrR family transcriptional regulator